MKRFLIIAVLLFAVFSGLFIWFEESGWLTAPMLRDWMAGLQASRWGWLAVTGGVFGLLLVDIVLPVPSSVVMTLAGALLGLWGGLAASFLGAMGAALTAYWACRLGGQAMFSRLSGNPADLDRVETWFEQYGVFAIVLSRPFPMLTEVLSCLAGLSGMRHRVFLLAATLGTLPVCLVYSFAGHYGSRNGLWLALLAALGIPAAGWAVVRLVEQRRTARALPSGRGGQTRAWCALLRLPNLFTVPGNVLAGFLLAAAATPALTPWVQADAGVMILAVLAVYMGGVVFNDVVDLERDRCERPDRPLPAGRISRRGALGVALLLALGGPLAAFLWVTPWAAVLLAAVAIGAFSYDGLKEKSSVAGVLLMGLARGGTVLCGAAALSLSGLQSLAVWLAAGSVLIYTMVVTGLARGEMRDEGLGWPAWLPSAALLGTAVLAAGVLASAGGRLWPALLFMLAAGESAWAAQRVIFRSMPIPPFIGQSIRIMIVSQCGWCVAAYALHWANSEPVAPLSLALLLTGFAGLRLAAEFAGRHFYGS